jgi:hypothetical protein
LAVGFELVGAEGASIRKQSSWIKALRASSLALSLASLALSSLSRSVSFLDPLRSLIDPLHPRLAALLALLVAGFRRQLNINQHNRHKGNDAGDAPWLGDRKGATG